MEALDALQNHNIAFQHFYAKGQISMESARESQSGNFTALIRKDSIVMLALKKFGIEGARVGITNQSYTILYRLEKLYEQGSPDDLRRYFGFQSDFQDIQNILIGNIFLPDTSAQFLQDDDHVILSQNMGDFESIYTLDRRSMELLRWQLADQKKRSVDIQFLQYKKVQNSTMPFERVIIVADPYYGDSEIRIDLTDITLDEPRDITFSIPANYTRI